MKTRAAVAFEAGKPLEIEMLDLEGPKAGEVLVRNVASGVCHTDAFTLSGEDPEGIFPAVLGHEGGAVVEEIGAGAGFTLGYKMSTNGGWVGEVYAGGGRNFLADRAAPGYPRFGFIIGRRFGS